MYIYIYLFSLFIEFQFFPPLRPFLSPLSSPFFFSLLLFLSFFLFFFLPIKKSPRRRTSRAPFRKKGIVGGSAPSKLHIARKLPSILRSHGVKKSSSLGRAPPDRGYISILFFYDPLVELYNSNCAKRLLSRN